MRHIMHWHGAAADALLAAGGGTFRFGPYLATTTEPPTREPDGSLRLTFSIPGLLAELQAGYDAVRRRALAQRAPTACESVPHMDQPLPITYHNLKSEPESGPSDHDGYRWHVGLDDVVLLIVDLSGSQAIETELGRTELNARLPTALQRYASGRLRADLPVLDQVAGWDSPVVLAAEHFR
jgi:hypothetical protein